MPIAADSYLYWAIAEGGTPLETAMPAFQGALKPEQMWQIILHLRRL
jgi:mono/diheme cytochrome c family protein